MAHRSTRELYADETAADGWGRGVYQLYETYKPQEPYGLYESTYHTQPVRFLGFVGPDAQRGSVRPLRILGSRKTLRALQTL